MSLVNFGLALLSLFHLGMRPETDDAESPGFRPVVEAEEEVYSYEPADNGAGPMWCHGSTCLVRIGEDVFASGLETLRNFKPLNNCRWLLFRRCASGWEKVQVDETGRTREPSPLACFKDGPLFLSANPTLVTSPDAHSGPARPEILQWSPSHPDAPQKIKVLLPTWQGTPEFTEHSYRSFAADGRERTLVLFQNVGYTHAEWSFLDRKGCWSSQGKLQWPWGADYEVPQPIRVCYPNVALKGKEVHFCGVSDIVEPNSLWREFKLGLTGQKWDYDFRRLFYTWTPNVTQEPFNEWIEIASREKTCGWVSPGDLWVGPRNKVHILWTERAIDERLRERFFPEAKQSHELNYAVLRKGEILLRRTLLKAEEGGSQEIPGQARFHITPNHRLFVITYVSGTDPDGQPISEDRIMELRRDGSTSPWVVIPLKHPLGGFFTATPRAGNAPSETLDLLGPAAGSSQTIRYAGIRIEP